MSTFTKNQLSGATNGKPIQVVATSTLGTTIHTAVSGTSAWDEIWLYATNNSGASVNLTIEFGGATSYNIVLAVPSYSGLTLIVPGLILQNSAVVSAFADSASVVSIVGYVNSIV